MALLLHNGSYTLLGEGQPKSVIGAVRFLVLAGLLNSLIAAFLLCRLPGSQRPLLIFLIGRGVIYVGIGALAGVAGAWLYWKRASGATHLAPLISFRLFALTCAAAWLWVPSAVLLLRRDSPVASAVAAIGAAILAIGLRKTVPLPDSPHENVGEQSAPKELFAETLATPPRRVHGYVIALCIYAGAYALHDGSTMTACGLLALCGFIFTWEATLAPSRRSSYWDNRRAALRLARLSVPAVLVMVWALLAGIAHREHDAASAAAFAHGEDFARKVATVQNPDLGPDGYESIILWPFPEKKQIIPPVPAQPNLLAPGTSQPFVIRFNGPYWYFQPGRRPDSGAHEAQGTPLGVHIHSTNSIPLTIEAHQDLSVAIPLARCSAMELEIENRDNLPGAIALAVLVADSTAAGKPALYLGQQPLKSTQPDQFSLKTVAAYETLRFAIPPHADIRKFDRITVMLLPDIEHALVGPKIAIQQFALFPR